MRFEILVLAVATVTVVGAWAKFRWQERNDDQSHKAARRQKQKRKPGPVSYRRDMTELEYIKLIPKQDMQQLQELLDLVYTGRGWGASDVQCMGAWSVALSRAMSDENGAWQPHLPAATLQPDRLQQLVNLLDELFLGGQLQGWLELQGKPRMRVQPISYSLGPDDWYANFFPEQNTVALKRHKWAEERLIVTPQRPADYEGIHCTCRLKVLMHTLAHEMTHALVYQRLPTIDSSSHAYLVDDRHGPVFRLLSHRLFGHRTEDFKRSRT